MVMLFNLTEGLSRDTISEFPVMERDGGRRGKGGGGGRLISGG